MLNIGFLLIGIGVIWYIVHAVIYNRFLGKHHPEIFDDNLQSQRSGKRNKKAIVVVTGRQTPAWIMLFGTPPIPIFFLGIVITVVTLIINAFQ
jgi:hypothetical protein